MLHNGHNVAYDLLWMEDQRAEMNLLLLDFTLHNKSSIDA